MDDDLFISDPAGASPVTGTFVEPTCEPNRAVESMLQHHPQVQVQNEQVKFSRGALQAARGQFDATLTANLQQGRTTTPLTSLQIVQAEEFGIDAVSDKSDATMSLSEPPNLFATA